jgi:hypothetical protein
MQLHMICVLPLLTTACQVRRLRISVPLVECLVDGQKYLCLMICRHAGSLLLNERGSFITALPEREVDQAEWQAAIKALIPVAELGGATMFAGSA